MKFRLRPIDLADAPAINALRRMPGVFENTLGMPSERISQNEDFLSSLDHNDHEFVAVIDTEEGEQVIGMAGIAILPRARLRHSATFGILVHPDWQGRGVGTALIGACLDLADNWLRLVRVELTVYPDNERAIRMYEKHGFVMEGRKRKAVIRGGEYIDELLMARVRDGEAGR